MLLRQWMIIAIGATIATVAQGGMRQVEVASTSPRLYRVSGFATDEEMNKIIEANSVDHDIVIDNDVISISIVYAIDTVSKIESSMIFYITEGIMGD